MYIRHMAPESSLWDFWEEDRPLQRASLGAQNNFLPRSPQGWNFQFNLLTSSQTTSAKTELLCAGHHRRHLRPTWSLTVIEPREWGVDNLL